MLRRAWAKILEEFCQISSQRNLGRLTARASPHSCTAMARAPLLQLSGISLTFGGNPVFDNLDLVVDAGWVTKDVVCQGVKPGSVKAL